MQAPKKEKSLNGIVLPTGGPYLHIPIVPTLHTSCFQGLSQSKKGAIGLLNDLLHFQKGGAYILTYL